MKLLKSDPLLIFSNSEIFNYQKKGLFHKIRLYYFYKNNMLHDKQVYNIIKNSNPMIEKMI